MVHLDMEGHPIVIHYGSKKFDPKRFRSVRNDHWVKPKGCLWTSPVGSEFGWKEWCVAEHFRKCTKSNSFLLQFEKTAKILIINTLEDLVALPKAKNLEAWGIFSTVPDFEFLRKKYSAIWLTEEGQRRTRLTHPHNLYGWDCETVLIMDPHSCFQIRSEKI